MSLTEPIGDPGSPATGENAQRSPRVPATQLETPRARLLPGGDVDVINISDTGLLVEGKARPGVGTTVTIRIQGSRARLEGRIVRCRISTIHRDGTLSYDRRSISTRPHREIVNARATLCRGSRFRQES